MLNQNYQRVQTTSSYPKAGLDIVVRSYTPYERVEIPQKDDPVFDFYQECQLRSIPNDKEELVISSVLRTQNCFRVFQSTVNVRNNVEIDGLVGDISKFSANQDFENQFGKNQQIEGGEVSGAKCVQYFEGETQVINVSGVQVQTQVVKKGYLKQQVSESFEFAQTLSEIDGGVKLIASAMYGDRVDVRIVCLKFAEYQVQKEQENQFPNFCVEENYSSTVSQPHECDSMIHKIAEVDTADETQMEFEQQLKKRPQQRKSSFAHRNNEDSDFEYDIEQTQDINEFQTKKVTKRIGKASYHTRRNRSRLNSETEDLYEQNRGQKVKKGDKKNVVKNFAKAFKQYMASSEEIKDVIGVSEEKANELKNIYADFSRVNSHFNNKLIRDLITSSQFSKIFNHFLNQRAMEWLSSSQVGDKKAHHEVLQGYIRASNNPEELDSIIILKSRG